MNCKFKYIIFVVLTTIFVSCTNWLDVKPKSEIERKAFYETEDGFEAALVGCYVKMKTQDLYGKELTMLTLEYMAQQWKPMSIDDNNVVDYEPIRNFKYTQTEELYRKIYAGLYNAITQANDILNYLETNGHVITSLEKRDLIKGEALAIRAFCHFDILRLFGQMPNGTGKKVSLAYSRQTGNKPVPIYTYEQYKIKVIEDYKQAAELLKSSDPIMKFTFDQLNNPYSLQETDANAIESDFWAYRRVRMNYYAVNALIARAYLYFGETQNAYEYASKVINAKYESGKEVITIDNLSADFQNGRYTLPGETLFALNVYNISGYVDPLFRSRSVISAADANAEINKEIFDNQKDLDSRGQLWYEEVSDPNAKKNTIKKYWQVKGMTDTNDPDSYSQMYEKQMVPLMRLSEVYLIAIETSSDINISNTLFKNYKRSRGLIHVDIADETTLKEEILKEYRKEFYAEGQMFFTYKRFGLEHILWRTNKMTDAEYVVPTPTSEIK